MSHHQDMSRQLSAPAAPSGLEPHERQRCEIWTRVMGYHRPVSSFNRGKKGEFRERVCFSESIGMKHDLAAEEKVAITADHGV